MTLEKPAGFIEWDGNSSQETQNFIDDLCIGLRDGYGYVPFIGAGFLAPSGTPLTHEVEEYLQRCICISLGIDGEGIPDNDMQPWNPRTDQWPPFIDRRRIFDRGYWAKLLVEKIHTVSEKEKTKKDLQLLSEGFVAMNDWRTALHFLSRLNRKRRGTNSENSAWLEAPQQEVIEACIREVLKDKSPTLGHRMLVALAGAMRLDIVLTTNFDNLLERAFEAARTPIAEFKVELDDKLPDWSTLSSVRALVKIHGVRSLLREEYLRDKSLTEEDKQAFLHYLLSSKGRNDLNNTVDREKKGLDFRNYLLVIGFSAKNRTIRALIEYACQHLNSAFRVFWICHTPEDTEEIKKIFGEIRVNGSSDANVTVLRHTHPDLLLLQLYQSLRNTLPPIGSIFPSVARIAYPPLVPDNIKKELEQRSDGIDMFVAKLIELLSDFDSKKLWDFEDKDWDRSKVVLVSSERQTSGLTSVCARAFRKLEDEGKICLWVDMNDISSTDNLFEVLLETIYYRLGFEDWIPPMTGSRSNTNDRYQQQRREQEIDRLIHSVNKRWIVFLNGRETPGANMSDSQKPDGIGWFGINPHEDDEIGPYEDKSSSYRSLVNLLKALCRPNSRMSVVLMCRDPDLFSRNEHIEPIHAACLKLEEQVAPAKQFFNPNDVVDRALSWADMNRKKRFLRALVYMQRPRHPATIWSSALAPGTTDAKEQIDWINKLEDCGLVRRKPGGLIWVHSVCRQMIRQKLGSIVETDPMLDESEIHKEIAEWYKKVLDASETPAAAFEAAYHFCRAADALLKKGAAQYGIASIEAATSILRSNTFLIQTHGYSRGSCRKLNMIASIGMEIYAKLKKLENELGKPVHGTQKETIKELETCKAAVKSLWIICAEIMRAIAREVGEDSKAYYRHRQVGRLACGTPWDVVCQREPPNLKISNNLRKEYHVVTTSTSVPDAWWIRWRRWLGMLAIASRSYDKAEHLFSDILGPFEKQAKFKDFMKEVKSQAQRLELLRMMEQSVELLLLQCSLARRINDLGGIPPASTEPEMLFYAEKMTERANLLARKIKDSDTSSDSHEIILAHWCTTRLLMHRSVIESRYQALRKRPRQILNAIGILSDAESQLRLSDPRRSRSELALIDLHRADAKISEAESMLMNVDESGSECPLKSLISLLETKEHANDIKAQCDFISNAHTPSILTQVSALVADSERFLNRAEPVLRERRRNVYWTTWFFERKLRTIALSVTVSVFDSGGPIPFLGLEAAMRLTETEADCLLNDSIRMVRVDAYRLACVIDAYLSCIRALNVRLEIDQLNDVNKNLTLRPLQMLVNLREAHFTLDAVYKLRSDVEGPSDTVGMDSTVKHYVINVQSKVREYLHVNREKLDKHDRSVIEAALIKRICSKSAGREAEEIEFSVRLNIEREWKDLALKRKHLSLMTGLRIEILESKTYLPD